MSNTATDETGPQPAGALEVLARIAGERKKFLKMVGKGVGSAAAATSLAAFIAACGSSSSSKSTSTAAPATTSSASNSGDIAIVNYALTLEYLETEFYKKVVAAKMFSGKVGALLEEFSKQEQSHVIALTAAIKGAGGTPAAKPNGMFPITSPSQVANLAYTVENLGASAYLGQAAKIQSKQVLAAALAIHSVEARHAATLGTLVNKSVTPNGAFAVPADIPTVLVAVKPFLG